MQIQKKISINFLSKFWIIKSDLMDHFSFNFKKCGIDPGETANEPPTLTILDDFCAAENFEEIVTAPADPASIGGTGASSFDNFDFTIFKFPGQEKGNSMISKLNISELKLF